MAILAFKFPLVSKTRFPHRHFQLQKTLPKRRPVSRLHFSTTKKPPPRAVPAQGPPRPTRRTPGRPNRLPHHPGTAGAQRSPDGPAGQSPVAPAIGTGRTQKWTWMHGTPRPTRQARAPRPRPSPARMTAEEPPRGVRLTTSPRKGTIVCGSARFRRGRRRWSRRPRRRGPRKKAATCTCQRHLQLRPRRLSDAGSDRQSGHVVGDHA